MKRSVHEQSLHSLSLHRQSLHRQSSRSQPPMKHAIKHNGSKPMEQDA